MPPPPPTPSLEWSGAAGRSGVVYVILIPFHSILRQNVEFTRVLCSRFTFWQRRGGEKERAFPICNPPFPEKEERERKGVFSPRHSGPLCRAERGGRGEESAPPPPRISFRRRRQATKTYKSGQMKRETGREYRMDRGAGRSKGALAELLPPPFGAHETSSTRLESPMPSALSWNSVPRSKGSRK